MDEIEKERFYLHSTLPRFRRRVDEALAIIDEALALPGPHLVSNSWGKDSVVLLHLVYTLDPAIHTIHVGDEHEDLIDNFSQVRDRFRARCPLANYHHVTAKMGGLSSRQGIDQSAIGRLAQVRFIGLRSEERGGREWSLGKYGPIHQYWVGDQVGTWRICPLLNWTWLDVWGYTARYDLPHLNYYDSPVAGDKRYSRTSSICGYRLFDPTGGHGGTGFGRIAKLRAYAPEYYELMVRQYPYMAGMT